jgi:hypothetical protein
MYAKETLEMTAKSLMPPTILSHSTTYPLLQVLLLCVP